MLSFLGHNPRCLKPLVDSRVVFPLKHDSGNCSVSNLIYENFEINFRSEQKFLDK